MIRECIIYFLVEEEGEEEIITGFNFLFIYISIIAQTNTWYFCLVLGLIYDYELIEINKIRNKNKIIKKKTARGQSYYYKRLLIPQ